MSDYYPTAVDYGPLFTLARRNDPPTSQAAARRAPRSGHCRLILAAFGQGPAGQTEIARRSGLTVAAVSKRLPDLRRVGAIELTGREVEGGEREYRIASMEARTNGR